MSSADRCLRLADLVLILQTCNQRSTQESWRCQLTAACRQQRHLGDVQSAQQAAGRMAGVVS